MRSEEVAYTLRQAGSSGSQSHQALMDNEFRRGIQLFNCATFFEAHEVWDDIWRATAGPEKRFLQGLIQIAVAFHHHATGNLIGARSLLERGCRNLSDCPDGFRGIHLSALRRSLADWQVALAMGSSVPPLPQLRPRVCVVRNTFCPGRSPGTRDRR